jgi:hypothetical protein
MSTGETFGSNDLHIKLNRRTSMNSVRCCILFTTANYGVGIARNSLKYQGGLILTTLLHALIAAASYYSLWMLSYVASVLKNTRYEGLWRRSGLKGSFFVALCTFLVSGGWISVYISYMCRFMDVIADYYFPTLPILNDPFLTNFILLIVVFLPVVMSRDLLAQEVAAALKIILGAIFFGICVYWNVLCSSKPKTKGTKVALFDGGTVFSSLSDFMINYLNFMLLFPAFERMKDLTFVRLDRCLRWSIFAVFFGNEVFAYMQYFMFYQDRETELVMEQIGYDEPSARVGLIILYLFLVTTIPPFLEPMRISLLDLAREMDLYPLFIWSAVGLIWMIVTILMSIVVRDNLDIIRRIAVASAGIIQFTFPGILCITHRAKLPKLHWVGAIAYIFLGVGMSITGAVIGIMSVV